MGLYHGRRPRPGQPCAGNLPRLGFSRGELLMCLVLAAFMLAVLLPWLNYRRDQARQTNCEDRQTQLGRALQMHALFHERFPGWVNPRAREAERFGPRSWAVEILPWVGRFITADELADRANYDHERRGPRHDDHAKLLAAGDPAELGARQFIGDLLCPEDPRAAQRSGPVLGYVVNGGRPDQPPPADPPDALANGVFLDAIRDTVQVSSPQYVEDHDGAAFTLLLAENIDAGAWTDLVEPKLTFLWSADDAAEGERILPINDRLGRGDGSTPFARPAGRHGKGVNVVFVDGQSKFIPADIAPRLWVGLMTSDEQHGAVPEPPQPE